MFPEWEARASNISQERMPSVGIRTDTTFATATTVICLLFRYIYPF